MFAQVILQGNGPLPLKGSFTFEGSDDATLLISGSAYAAGGAGTMLQLELSIDGNGVAGASVFANEAQSHKALVSPLQGVNPGFGAHQITLAAAAPGTVTDANDFFTVTLIY